MRSWFALLVSAPLLCAQGKFYDNNLHGWLVYNGDHPVSDRWGAHIEAQWRRHEFLRPQQLLLRWAANYRLNAAVQFSAGYAWVSTHRYGEFPIAVPFPEHRLYQQAVINHAARGNAYQHRFRIEQRWLGVRAATPSGERIDLGDRYQNRFRHFFRLGRAIQGPLSFVTHNEIFFNLPPFHGAPGFDQNRAFVGVGWQLGPFHRLETGYMQQTLLQRSGRVAELNHTMHLSLHSVLPFR
jgi:hypothetical protein